MKYNLSSNSNQKNIKFDLGNKILFILLLEEQSNYLKIIHSYHFVDLSPWPAVASLRAFMTTPGFVLYMHKFMGVWVSANSFCNVHMVALCYSRSYFWRPAHCSCSKRSQIWNNSIHCLRSNIFLLFFELFSINIRSYLTWAHHALVTRAKKQASLARLLTLILVTLLTCRQGLEYLLVSFIRIVFSHFTNHRQL